MAVREQAKFTLKEKSHSAYMYTQIDRIIDRQTHMYKQIYIAPQIRMGLQRQTDLETDFQIGTDNGTGMIRPFYRERQTYRPPETYRRERQKNGQVDKHKYRQADTDTEISMNENERQAQEHALTLTDKSGHLSAAWHIYKNRHMSVDIHHTLEFCVIH